MTKKGISLTLMEKEYKLSQTASDIISNNIHSPINSKVEIKL